jgi:hypothetical protein
MSPPARAQEAATDFNQNQRFGRMELVAERVADSSREKFFERRKLWGNKIQVADTEVLSFKMKSDSEAFVTLKVGWYKVDEGDLRTTVLKQTWKDLKGAWKLVSEERTDGDVGLLGEAPEPVRPEAAAALAKETSERRAADRRRFATMRLGQPDAPAEATEEDALPEPSTPASGTKADATKPDATKSSDATKPSVQSASAPAAQNTKAEPPSAAPVSAEAARRPASGTP